MWVSENRTHYREVLVYETNLLTIKPHQAVEIKKLAFICFLGIKCFTQTFITVSVIFVNENVWSGEFSYIFERKLIVAQGSWVIGDDNLNPGFGNGREKCNEKIDFYL